MLYYENSIKENICINERLLNFFADEVIFDAIVMCFFEKIQNIWDLKKIVNEKNRKEFLLRNIDFILYSLNDKTKFNIFIKKLSELRPNNSLFEWIIEELEKLSFIYLKKWTKLFNDNGSISSIANMYWVEVFDILQWLINQSRDNQWIIWYKNFNFEINADVVLLLNHS